MNILSLVPHPPFNVDGSAEDRARRANIEGGLGAGGPMRYGWDCRIVAEFSATKRIRLATIKS